MKYDVFISYSRKDSEIAEKIFQTLTQDGLSCFIDRAGISGGADFPTVLSTAILESRILLLVASKNSYASEFTQKELTFAISEKGNQFIFPLIVDGSELPTTLRFLLININWRTLSKDYTIEKQLVEDIHKKLENDETGISLEQLEHKSNRKWLFTTLGIVGVVLLVVLALVLSQARSRIAQSTADKTAEADARSAKEYIQVARGFLQKADSLRSCGMALQTVGEENAALNEASALLRRSDSLKSHYQTQASYAYLFSQVSTEPLKQEISHRRDSMFAVWNGYALNNYRDYQDLPDEVNQSIASKYVDIALQIRPDNETLLDIKERLNQ